jgi:2-hydroxyglutarate dehydrogenase
LDDLQKRGTVNGVEGLVVLNSAEVTAMEPNVQVHSALWSPNTGIADYACISRHVAQLISEDPRGAVHTHFQVTGMEETPDGTVRITGLEPGQKGPTKSVLARNVITVRHDPVQSTDESHEFVHRDPCTVPSEPCGN